MNSLRRRRADWGEGNREQEYWLSYSDLLAGLLMVFALVLFAALKHYGGIIEEAGRIAATRTQIVALLQELVEEDQSGVTVDPITGTVRFPDGVLFDQARWELSASGRQQLSAFADRYFTVLLERPEIRDEIRTIVIEGHTNDDGSYEYNLDLSQRRASSVMSHFLTTASVHGQELKSLVAASGRSYMDLIECEPGVAYEYECPPGEPDKVSSRRIEIVLRLKDEELLERVRQLLIRHL
jgi:chemotaxis protein MotB